MTYVQRIGIQGVRSFNPEEPQEIQFFPLTIILGPNGAGKTSIIESLKYATTGIWPPNSNGGKTFIHDIHYANQPIIRGQVRLKFIDVEKKSTVVTRSIQASLKYQKNKKPQVTFRQINSVIKREGKSIDQKCVDVNSELLELIGVSKAVLTNVIFCHQEETNWPLSDGKVLKEKFDDIFGSYAYVQALEKIKKSREEEVKIFHLLEKDVNFALHLKKEADSKQKSIKEEKSKVDFEKEKIKKLETKFQEINEKLDDLIDKESSAEEFSNEISQIQGSILEKKKLAEGIQKSSFTSLQLSKTKDEVDIELDNFDDNALSLKIKKNELSASLKKIDAEYFELINEKQKFSVDIAKISEYENQLAKYINQRNAIIDKIDKPSLEIKFLIEKITENQDFTIVDYETVLDYYQKEISLAQDSLKAKMENFRDKECILKSELELLKGKKSKACNEKELWLKQVSKIQNELSDLAQDNIGEIKTFANCLSELDKKISFYKDELAKIEENKYIDFNEKIEALEKEKNFLNNEIEKIEQFQYSANANNQEKIKFDYLNKEKEDKLSKIETIKMNNFEVFAKISPDESNFYAKLSNHITVLNESYDRINSEIANYEKEYYTEKTTLKSKQDLFNEKSANLLRIENKISDICEIDKFETFLSKTSQELTELRLQKSTLENISPFIKNQILVIESTKTCPVCEHDLSLKWLSKKSGEKIDYQTLLADLEKTRVENPNELKQVSLKISEKETLYNKLIVLQNDIVAMKNISSEIYVLKTEVSALIEKTKISEDRLQKEKSKANRCKCDIENLRKCLTFANEYDNLYKEHKQIVDEIAKFDCTKWDNKLDLEELNFKAKEKRLSLKICDKKLSDIQKESRKNTAERMKMQSLLQTAEQSKNDLEKREQQKKINLIKKNELLKEMDELNNKITELEKESTSFEPEIYKAELKLNELKENVYKIEKEMQQKVYFYENSFKTMNDVIREIQKYSNELDLIKMKTSSDYIKKIENNLSTIETEKKTITKEISDISQEIANLELRKRELLDYQRLLTLRKSIKEQEEKLEEYKKKMGYLDIRSIKHSRINTEREAQSIVTQKQTCLERISELNKRIGSLNAELEKEMYSKAEENYRQKLFDKTISELACDDLNKYYKALDNGISTFHKCKMEEINKLIEIFWSIAYQGKDIDCIKIVSDEEERSASDRRRTYNYRVVMFSKNKEMDMKGRCSAGQKVLASLIIRLALAVIFCRAFPVLTLDEPTTNLDKATIHSFAKAIVNLIKSCQGNRNFQIIIITHDEEFLECLNADTGEFYYKVFKNEHGYSTIMKKSILQNENFFSGQTIEHNNRLVEKDEDEIPLQLASKKDKQDKNLKRKLESEESFLI